MKKSVKKILIVMTLAVMFCAPLHTYAAEAIDDNDYSNEVVPGREKTRRWSFTDSAFVGMSIDTEGYVTVNCGVNGYMNMTEKIIIYVYLQKRVGDYWENVDMTVDIVYDWSTSLEDYYEAPVDWGYDYRTRNSIYVYAGEEYEHIELFSQDHHYHHPDGIPDCSLNE